MEELKRTQDIFRDKIIQVFSERKSKNPAYSIRAYAQSLEINDSSLSQIMKGKRTVSLKMMKRLSLLLGFSISDLTMTDFDFLEFDQAQSLSHWSYDAILELTQVTGLEQVDVKAYAERVGRPDYEVQSAIKVLSRLGLMSEGENSEIKNTTTILPPEIESVSLKKYQESLISESLKKLYEIKKSERDHTSVVLAMNPKDLNKIRDKIKKLRREIVDIVAQSEHENTEVYALQISAFPLTQITKQGDTK